MAEKLNEENFEEFISGSELPVLVDFYSDGCVPCRRIAPFLSKAEEEYGSSIAFAKVNIGLNPALIEKYGVEAAPTLLVFQNGEEIARHRGSADLRTFQEFVENIV